jgi:hypothetical protein
MTLKKKSQERRSSYDTFPTSSSESQRETSSSTPNNDKARAAGLEAQQLASQGFWSDDYGQNTLPPSSPRATMGNSADRGLLRDDPDDPPPIYTPSETTATSTPPSPIAARAQPHSVGGPQSPIYPSHPAIIEEPETQPSEDDDMYASSPLLERADHQSEDVQPSGRCRWRRRHASHDGKDRKRDKRRFRRICWFTFALALCLWLMVPALMGGKVLPDHTRYIEY